MLGWMGYGCMLAVRAARGGDPSPVPARQVRGPGLVLLGALALLLGWNGVEIAENVRDLKPRGQGDEAPALALRPLDPAGPRSLAELRGRVVLVDFWATWCVPCRRSMPAIEKLWKTYRDQGLTVVSINVENDAAGARAFAERFQPRLDFPLFVDDGAAQAVYRVDSIPHLVLIGRDGRIDLVHVGGFDADELGERIADLTAAQPPSAAHAPGG
jgi:thiol-disulfide isomerase/thioredoxin